MRRIEERLNRASAAAERLMAQAVAEAAGGGSAGEGHGDPGGDPGKRGDAPQDPGGGPGSSGRGPGNSGRGPGNSGGGPGNSGGGPEDRGESDADDAPKPPPAGWQFPQDAPSSGLPDLDPFVALVQAVRDLIPPELQRRLVAALRELLLALRALIDWYLERLERRREQAVEVEEIPIL
ncbi:MAG TPA: hypothetical protein VEF89_00985 [Solirubrobacteraceae bacterium]|nr:hypothetical protein [Solirubrobacteraceae bacterium]